MSRVRQKGAPGPSDRKPPPSPNLYVVVRYLEISCRHHAHLRQRATVEHLRKRALRVQHDQSDGAFRLVQTIVAALITSLARTRQRREWAVDDSNDFADADLAGRARQHVTAALAHFGIHESSVTQFGQYRIKKFLRDLLRRSDFQDGNGTPGRKLREMHHRLQAIFAFLGQHAPRLSLKTIS